MHADPAPMMCPCWWKSACTAVLNSMRKAQATCHLMACRLEGVRDSNSELLQSCPIHQQPSPLFGIYNCAAESRKKAMAEEQCVWLLSLL